MGAAGNEAPLCHLGVAAPHTTLGVTEKNKTLIMYRNLSCKNNKIFFSRLVGI